MVSPLDLLLLLKLRYFLDPIFHTILDACMPADRANDKEVFVTLEDVMKEKCLDHVTTLWGLDEKTIEEDFKAVDTDEDGKLTMEEGLKVYEYSREAMGSAGICVYDCCYYAFNERCGDSDFETTYLQYKRGTTDLSGGCNEQYIRLTSLGEVYEVSFVDFFYFSFWLLIDPCYCFRPKTD